MPTMQECVRAIAEANAADAADLDWLLPQEDQLAAIIYAQRLRRIHRKMVLAAAADKPTFTDAELTLDFLEDNNAVFRRRLETELLQNTSLTRKQARNLLTHSVLAHRHAADLLVRLEAGQATVAEAEIVLTQLTLLPVPNRRRTPEGEPWQPDEYPAARRAAARARSQLGEELTQLTAAGLPAADLATRAGQLRNTVNPISPARRAAAAKASRYVRIAPAEDGMAYLQARIGAADGALIQARLAALAQRVRGSGRGEARTPSQLEADLLVAALTGPLPDPTPPTAAGEAGRQQTGSSAAADVVVMVEVTLAQAIMLGNYVDPERLQHLKKHFPDLYEQSEKNRRFYATAPEHRSGTLPPGVAESGASVKITGSALRPSTVDSAELLARATLIRAVLTHPFTGYPLGVGQQSYRVPEQVRQLIRYRDQTCRHPGCDRPAGETELDHVQPWADGGQTGYASMVCLCPEHHRAKTAKWYRLKQRPDDGDGVLEFGAADREGTVLSDPVKGLDPIAWQAYRSENQAGAEPPF